MEPGPNHALSSVLVWLEICIDSFQTTLVFQTPNQQHFNHVETTHVLQNGSLQNGARYTGITLFLPDIDSLSICNSFVCVWIEDKDTGITEAEDIIFCKISETIISFTQPRETSAFVVPLKKFGKRRLTRTLHACSCRSLIIFPHYDANCFISLFIFAVLQVMWWR